MKIIKSRIQTICFQSENSAIFFLDLLFVENVERIIKYAEKMNVGWMVFAHLIMFAQESVKRQYVTV